MPAGYGKLGAFIRMTSKDDMAPSAGEPARVMFLYWGRRGPLSLLTRDLARAALAVPGLRPFVSVSRQNESFAEFAEFGDALFPIDTFATNRGALLEAWRLPLLRRRLVAKLRQDRIEAVVTLMPHVWSPLVSPAIRRAGVRYATVIHDADAHPGDPTSLVQGWGLRDVLHADVVVTLSNAVAGRLEATGHVPRDKLAVLFLPDLLYGQPLKPRPPAPGEPFRLLFLGRVMPYKGLPLLLDAMDILRAEGLAVELGVHGDGALGDAAERLRAMGAEVDNTWLSDRDIEAVLPRYHAVVLSHIEASQSGVASTAFGSGIPVISTPVGGLPEQVLHGRTGVVSEAATPRALADAIRTLCLDPGLYRSICRQIDATREDRSVKRFVAGLVANVLKAERPR